MPFSVSSETFSYFHSWVLVRWIHDGLVLLGKVTYSLLVDDLDNGSQLGVVNQDNTAQLDESPGSSLNGGRHGVDCME